MEFLNRQRAWILSVTSMSMALIYLENTVLPVALPTIAKGFNLTDLSSMWIINVYLLMLAMFFLVGGRLSDVYGKRPCFLTGLFLFGLGSLICSASYDRNSLFLGRMIQGLGGALNIPTIGALIIANFPKEVRGRAVGLNSSLGSFFLLIGPLVGGVITTYFGWRYIFWLNIPIVLFIFVTMAIILPKEERKEGSMNTLAALPLVAALFFLVFALMQGPFWGWFSWKILLLFPLSGFFVYLYHRIEKKSEHPIFRMELLKNSTYRGSVLNVFINQMTVIVGIFLPLFLQEGRNYSPVEAGLLMMASTSPYLIFPTIGGFLADRISPRLPITLGFLMMIIGLSSIYLFVMDSIWKLEIGLFIYGAGSPMIFSPSYAAAMSHAPQDHLGAASSLITTFRQVAATLGLGLMTALYHSVFVYCNSYYSAISALLVLALLLTLTGLILSMIFMRPSRVHDA